MKSDGTEHVGTILRASCIAALGGMLFGYDTAVIAGTIEYIQPYFGLSDLELGWTVSSALLGCMLGAAIAGWCGDRYGRKASMFACAILFLLSAVWSGLARSMEELVWARVLGGVGVGAASLLTPIYIAEIAPSKMRGALTTLNQIAILVGIVVVYLVNSQLAQLGDETWRLNAAWRWMFLSGALPSLLYFGLLFFIPESPRWLFMRQRDCEAHQIFAEFGVMPGTGLGNVPSLENSKEATWGKIFSPPDRRMVIIGAVLAICPQIAGINIVMYYAPRIFTDAGLAASAAVGHSVVIGLTMLLFTLVALILADRVGRRPLLLISSGGMMFSLAGLGLMFERGGGGTHALLIMIILYVAFFSIAMGPLVWTVITEIFPNRIRGRAASVCVLLLWITNFLVSQFFPFLLARLGAFTFWLHASAALFAFVFIFLFIPETKGRSLEDLEKTVY